MYDTVHLAMSVLIMYYRQSNHETGMFHGSACLILVV